MSTTTVPYRGDVRTSQTFVPTPWVETYWRRGTAVRTESDWRFAHLPMDVYQRTMRPEDFQFFTDFVGSGSFGFTPEDFEEFYDPEA